MLGTGYNQKSSMPPTDPQGITPVDQGTQPADLSQYIRTYAKDVALLSGKGNVGALQKAKPAPSPVSVASDPNKPRGEVSDGVEFDATVQPFFEQTLRKEENPYIPIDIESRAELDSFVEKGGAPIPASGVAAERENVLARLRSKMAVPKMSTPIADVTPLPEQPPVPVFSAPAPEPVYAMPPVYREPITEVAQQPAPLPVPKAVLPTPIVKQAAPSPFHSFSTDFKDRSKETSATSFSVLAAGLDAGQTMRAPSSSTRERAPVLAIALGVVLLVLATGGSYALYLYVGARHTVPAITLSIPSLIFADDYRKVEGTGKELMQSLANVALEPLPSGTATVTYIAQPATGETGTIAGTPAPGGLLIKALSLPAPELLTRNTDDSSTVGVIHEGGETRAFFILRVTSYERTFAGMLTWEPLMARDFGPLYPSYTEDEAPIPQVDLGLVSTTTATTTARIATSTTPVPVAQISPAVSVGRFEDAIVVNRDVRVLRDTRGRSLLLYGYADKETLIIARNESAFAALLVRLSAGGK